MPRKTTKKSKSPVYFYDIRIDSRCVHSEHSSKECGHWSETWDNSFGYIRQSQYEYGFPSTLKFERGEEVIVVWAVWSSGNSFGNASGSGREVFGLFKDPKSARQLQEKLESITEYRETFITKDKQIHDLYIPWSGYFESLDCVHIEYTRIV